VVDRQRELAAAPRRQRRSLRADEVAEVEIDQQLERLLAELVRGGMELNLTAAIAQIEKGRLAVAAPSDDPPSDPVPGIRLNPGRQPLVSRANLPNLLPFLKRMRKRIDPNLANPLQLLPPVAEDVGELGVARTRSRREPIWALRLLDFRDFEFLLGAPRDLGR